MRSINTKLLSMVTGFIAALAVGVNAQDPPVIPPPPPHPVFQDDSVIKINSRLVQVPVSVIDANGNPVPGLMLEDFRVNEEGKLQEIDSLKTADQVPLDIAILFDVSASTDSMFNFQKQTAAKFLRQMMKPEDRATIFTIGQRAILVGGRETIENATESLNSIVASRAAEPTAFFDTVRAASDFLQINSPAGFRKVIVVISDGEDNFSEGLRQARRIEESRIVSSVENDPEMRKIGSIVVKSQETTKVAERAKVLKTLQDADIVHYSINPAGSSYKLNQISVFGQENMEVFSTQTGGTAYLPKFLPIDTANSYENTRNMNRNTEILERIFRQLASELRSQYVIQYYTEAEYPDNRFVRLDVTLNNRNDLKVRSRNGYYVKN